MHVDHGVPLLHSHDHPGQGSPAQVARRIGSTRVRRGRTATCTSASCATRLRRAARRIRNGARLGYLFRPRRGARGSCNRHRLVDLAAVESLRRARGVIARNAAGRVARDASAGSPAPCRALRAPRPSTRSRSGAAAEPGSACGVALPPLFLWARLLQAYPHEGWCARWQRRPQNLRARASPLGTGRRRVANVPRDTARARPDRPGRSGAAARICIRAIAPRLLRPFARELQRVGASRCSRTACATLPDRWADSHPLPRRRGLAEVGLLVQLALPSLHTAWLARRPAPRASRSARHGCELTLANGGPARIHLVKSTFETVASQISPLT